MRHRRPGRIPAREALLRNHAGHIGQPHQHLVVLLRMQPRGDLDRLIAVALVELVLQILHLHWTEAQQIGELAHRGTAVDQPLRDDVDPEFDPVAGQLRVVAIEDRSAPRRQQGQVDAIAFGQGLVLVILDQRDPPDPHRQQCGQSGLQPADQHRAPVEAVLQRARTDVIRPTQHHNVRIGIRRKRSAKPTKRAASG